MRKVPCRRARVKVTAVYREDGSVLQGTLRASCEGVKIELEVESDQDPERVREMVELAWNGCWTVQALLNPVGVSYDLEIVPVSDGGRPETESTR